MRTNIVLDEALVAEAMKLSGAGTKREVVDLALQEFVRKQRQRRLKRLKNSGLVDPDYDLDAMRRSVARDVD